MRDQGMTEEADDRANIPDAAASMAMRAIDGNTQTGRDGPLRAGVVSPTMTTRQNAMLRHATAGDLGRVRGVRGMPARDVARAVRGAGAQADRPQTAAEKTYTQVALTERSGPGSASTVRGDGRTRSDAARGLVHAVSVRWPDGATVRQDGGEGQVAAVPAGATAARGAVVAGPVRFEPACGPVPPAGIDVAARVPLGVGA